MKKMCLIAATAALVLGLTACGTPQESFTPASITSNKIVEKNEFFNKELDIPVISGMADAKLQETINASLEKDAVEFAAALENQSKTDYTSFKSEGIPWTPYEVITKWNLNLSNDKILSLSVDYYSFTGGAHGLTTRSCYNYQLSDGTLLTLPTIFSQGSDWKSRLDAYVVDAINADPDNFFPIDTPDNFHPVTDELQFFFTEDALVLNFGLYEIAPYSSGMPNVTIPSADIEDILLIQW